LSQSRRVDWQVVQRLGGLAVAAGAALLVAAFALLVLVGPSSGAVAAAATPAAASAPASTAATVAPAALAATTTSCYPLTETSATCYNAGEFCPTADLYTSGVAANGTPIACEPDGNTQPHWEDCTRVNFTATPASTAGTTPVCPVAIAGGSTGSTTSTPSATPGATAATTTSPAGAPATGGGTGPGISGTVAATGGAFMAVGAGLVFLSRRRSRPRRTLSLSRDNEFHHMQARAR
jgi:hypothetical protein